MKKTFLFLVCIISYTSMFSQKNIPCAHVHSVEGVPIYVMSEPSGDYEVVGNVTSTGAQLLVGAFSDGSEDALNIQELAGSLVNVALRKLRKGKVEEFDAIITDDGDNGTLIRFKE